MQKTRMSECPVFPHYAEPDPQRPLGIQNCHPHTPHTTAQLPPSSPAPSIGTHRPGTKRLTKPHYHKLS